MGKVGKMPAPMKGTDDMTDNTPIVHTPAESEILATGKVTDNYTGSRVEVRCYLCDEREDLASVRLSAETLRPVCGACRTAFRLTVLPSRVVAQG